MKKTPQYSQKIKKLYAALKKGTEKSKKVSHEDLMEAMVYASLCQDCPESAAKSALKKIQAHFVDFNDLRVARAEEIAEIMGTEISNADKVALKVTSMLNAVFQKYDSLIAENIVGAGKKSVKEVLEKMTGVSDFVKNFVYLTFVNVHAVPLTDKMIEYFKTYNLVDPEMDNSQINAFIEKQVSASEAYAFYSVIRHDSELASPKAAQILNEDKKEKIAKPKA
jgi:endonuclease III